MIWCIIERWIVLLEWGCGESGPADLEGAVTVDEGISLVEFLETIRHHSHDEVNIIIVKFVALLGPLV